MEFDGLLEWDPSQPDGQPRRRLDVSRAAKCLGFKATVDLRTGLKRTIEGWTRCCEQFATTPSAESLTVQSA